MFALFSYCQCVWGSPRSRRRFAAAGLGGFIGSSVNDPGELAPADAVVPNAFDFAMG